MQATSYIPFSRALVLGATGMIGAHVVRACLKRGFETRAFVRPSSDRRNLRGLTVQTAAGDLGNQESIARALEGCDLVIHAAAPYPQKHFGKGALLARARAGMSVVSVPSVGIQVIRGNTPGSTSGW